MKLLILIALIFTNPIWAENGNKTLTCQTIACGPNSFIEIHFSKKYVNISFVHKHMDFIFGDLFYEVGIIPKPNELENMHLDLDGSDCISATDNMADFACSGYVTGGSAKIREQDEGDPENKYKFFDVYSKKSSPWKIDLKSMLSPQAGPFAEYTWNFRITNGIKSQEHSFDVGQCTIKNY